MATSKLHGVVFGLLLSNASFAGAAEPASEVISPLSQVAYVSDEAMLTSPTCCTPPWAHRSGVFGEFLALRARDADVTYAIPVNGAVPEGGLGILDGGYDPGFRVGLIKALDSCSSVSLAYSGFFGSDESAVSAAAPFSLTKQLVHPNVVNAGANVPNAFGSYDIDYQLADFDYRFVFLSTDRTAANLLIGARVGRLDQELDVTYAGAGLTEVVSSDVRFSGAGIRLGADVEHHGSHGIYAYGKTAASFLAGEFETTYLHSSDLDPVIVATEWEAGRLMSILDLEFGLGWQHCSGCRISVGYLYSSWIGAVQTDEWISAVRNNAGNYQDLGDNLSFDGLVGRIEYRF